MAKTELQSMRAITPGARRQVGMANQNDLPASIALALDELTDLAALSTFVALTIACSNPLLAEKMQSRLNDRMGSVLIGEATIEKTQIIQRWLDLWKNGLLRLSERQQQILRLTANGENMKTIATELSVSIKTIEADRRTLMNIVEIYSVAELTKFAIRQGLISLDE